MLKLYLHIDNVDVIRTYVYTEMTEFVQNINPFNTDGDQNVSHDCECSHNSVDICYLPLDHGFMPSLQCFSLDQCTDNICT